MDIDYINKHLQEINLILDTLDNILPSNNLQNNQTKHENDNEYISLSLMDLDGNLSNVNKNIV